VFDSPVIPAPRLTIDTGIHSAQVAAEKIAAILRERPEGP
jgi:hypothetical protein